MTTEARTYTDTYPLDFNGYVTVSRPFERITADEVQAGDLLVLDSGLSRVTAVTEYNVGAANGDRLLNWPILHIAGATNIIRFPHEVVTVLRGAA